MSKQLSEYWKFATFLLGGFILGYFLAQASPAALMGDNADVDDNSKVIEVQVAGAGNDTENVAEVVEVSADDDAYLGDADAPIEIIEFSDYQCSYCQRFHLQTFGDLVENYVNTGKVKFVYRDYPLTFHANAALAAAATECADNQNYFWEMHDQIFNSLSEWSGSAEPSELFSSYAANMDLDVTEFQSCLGGVDVANEIQADLRDGLLYGVRATPTFFINGQKLEGAQPYSVFETVLDSMLEEL